MSRFHLGFRFTLPAMAFLVLGSVAGCQTTFEGEAQFPGGPRGCFEACTKQNMQMASFVYVGEYSSACACKPRTAPQSQQSASAAEAADDESQAAIVAASVGVEMQRRRLEQARVQSSAVWVGAPR